MTGICPIEGNKELSSTTETIDDLGNATADPPTDFTSDPSQWPVLLKDLQAGFSQKVTYSMKVDNLYLGSGETYPHFTKVVNFVDGYQLLQLDSYKMQSQEITLDNDPTP